MPLRLESAVLVDPYWSDRSLAKIEMHDAWIEPALDYIDASTWEDFAVGRRRMIPGMFELSGRFNTSVRILPDNRVRHVIVAGRYLCQAALTSADIQPELFDASPYSVAINVQVAWEQVGRLDRVHLAKLIGPAYTDPQQQLIIG